MNTTRSNSPESSSDRRRTASEGITPGNIVADFMRFGPAPTPTREAVAAVASFILLGIVIVVLQPDVIVSAIAAGAAVAVFAVRAAIGTRKWAQR